eukprot:scaffold27328_cov67-Phaeocystis_antarctica.AAC.3
MDAFDLVSKEWVDTLRPACRSCRQSSGCRGPSTRSGTWDLRPPAAAGGRPGSMYRLREACQSTPGPLRHCRPCVPCRRRPSTLLQASPVEEGAAGTLFGSWRRSSTRLLERGTSRPRCCTACAASIARGGCSVPGGRTRWPAPCRPLLGRRPPSEGLKQSLGLVIGTLFSIVPRAARMWTAHVPTTATAAARAPETWAGCRPEGRWRYIK